MDTRGWGGWGGVKVEDGATENEERKGKKRVQGLEKLSKTKNELKKIYIFKKGRYEKDMFV